MDDSIFKAIRETAFCEIAQDDFGQWYKNICRWYSKTFHTPLNQVFDMPDESVLRIYYEECYYNLKNSDTDEAKAAWDKLHEYFLGEDSLSDDDQDADDKWIEEELKNFESKKKKREQNDPKNVTKSSNNDNLPNLEREDSYSLDGESIDQIPSDDSGK